MILKRLGALAPVVILCAEATAQGGATATSAWSGEGAISASLTSGNTETQDAGLSVKLKRKGLRWTHAGETSFDYGRTNGTERKNRVTASGQIDRNFGPRWAGYGRFTYERNAFSGFENRYFLGLGVAWKTIESEATAWTLEAGPGYKIDEIRQTSSTPASREDNVSGRLGSKFKHAFNPSVSLSNDSEFVTNDATTQTSNVLALTAKLTGNLNARVSFDVRHDTSPRPGFEATDTTTKFSLVYKVP